MAAKAFALKKELRAWARAAAAATDAAYRRSASRAIAAAVLAHPAYTAAKTVFVYRGAPFEPDTDAIIAAALASGRRVCAPRTREAPRMDAVLFSADTVFCPGPFGIPEPAGAPLPPGEIDLALVPCLAASPDGVRLGHGGGYYDFFLRGCPAKRLCLCFSALLKAEIPAEPWDIPMDAVIAETGVYPPPRV